MRETLSIELASQGRDVEIIRRRRDGSVPRIVQTLDPTAIKPPPPIDPNGPGGRIFDTRRMARCSRQGMEIIAGLTDGHWGRLECGFRGLTRIFTLLKIRSAFEKVGVDVTMDFLVLGKGPRPTYNEKFWERYPKERPEGLPLPPPSKGRRARGK